MFSLPNMAQEFWETYLNHISVNAVKDLVALMDILQQWLNDGFYQARAIHWGNR